MDLNLTIAGLLRDLAATQTSTQKAYGYRRAATCVMALDRQIDTYLQPDRTLRKIAGVGPSSTRVIIEVIETGTSAIVEQAVSASDRAQDIQHSRELRVNFLSRAAARAVLADDTIDAIRPSDYQGDLQMHSEWSDGEPSLAEIADGCRARGYAYAAVTDHSFGLTIASGMSQARSAEQRGIIDGINRARAGVFRLLKGIEANIGADGALDLQAEETKELEVVLAAPHSRLRGTDDQTDRMLNAVSQPHVHILAHPRGRMMNTRAGIIADWDRVFARAAERQVAIELDGDPSRQDLDFSLAARALDAGCVFALDSDAHTVTQLDYAEFAIAHARLARIPADRIINCWPLDRLLAWLARRPAGRTRRGAAKSVAWTTASRVSQPTEEPVTDV